MYDFLLLPYKIFKYQRWLNGGQNHCRLLLLRIYACTRTSIEQQDQLNSDLCAIRRDRSLFCFCASAWKLYTRFLLFDGFSNFERTYYSLYCKRLTALNIALGKLTANRITTLVVFKVFCHLREIQCWGVYSPLHDIVNLGSVNIYTRRGGGEIRHRTVDETKFLFRIAGASAAGGLEGHNPPKNYLSNFVFQKRNFRQNCHYIRVWKKCSQAAPPPPQKRIKPPSNQNPADTPA